jgi:hypothetical protein
MRSSGQARRRRRYSTRPAAEKAEVCGNQIAIATGGNRGDNGVVRSNSHADRGWQALATGVKSA